MTRNRPLLRATVWLLSLGLSACSNPPYPRGDIEHLYPLEQRPELSKRTVDGRTLQIARMAGSGPTPLLFIHGSPGDWKAWAHYLDAPELDAFGPRIAVDRPGFGGSNPGQVIPDLRAQASLIAEMIPPGRPAIVVGHSLGGPLLAWIAIDHPEKVCGGVMVAGSIAPELEAPRWYNHLAKTWIADWLAPAEMLWSNQEMLVLQPQLQQLETAWPQLRRPLVIIQGERDELVDPKTADYAERVIPAAYRRVIRVAGQGHFILWKQPAAVIAAIRSLHCETSQPAPVSSSSPELQNAAP